MDETEVVKNLDPADHPTPPPKRMAPVAPADLKYVWPSIRDRVAKIESPEETIPEEVYAMCVTNAATLFQLFIDDEPIGLLVVRLIQPDLHIWLLSADNGYDVMTTFRPDLMEIARRAGAQKLTYGSRRRAWQEVSKDHGFSVRMIVYEAKVE
jgi:hypothetical protein